MNIENKNNKIIIDQDILQAELFEAISHPTRIQILKMLNDGALGFSELKRKLGISSSGNISHHLSKLITLIKTDAQGKYILTDQGREALLAIETTYYPSRKWIATTYATISALIFYGLFLTIAVITGWPEYAGIPIVFLPIYAVISTIIFYIIETIFIGRAIRKGKMYLGWRYYKSKQKSNSTSK